MWVTVMVSVRYGSNNNNLREWEKVDWIDCHFDCKHPHQRLLPAMQQFFWAWALGISSCEPCYHCSYFEEEEEEEEEERD